MAGLLLLQIVIQDLHLAHNIDPVKPGEQISWALFSIMALLFADKTSSILSLSSECFPFEISDFGRKFLKPFSFSEFSEIWFSYHKVRSGT